MCGSMDDTFENIMLREISQLQKDLTIWFHLNEVPVVIKFIKWNGVYQRDSGEGEMENYHLVVIAFHFFFSFSG